MRLTQYLSEKINLNYKLKAANYYDSGHKWEVEFDIGDKEFTFMAKEYQLATESPKIRTFLGAPKDYKGSTTLWDLEFAQDVSSGKEHYITGKAGGQASEVFSAVATATKQFILKKRPDYFTFSGREPSRKRLYDRFAKMIVKVSSGSYEYLGKLPLFGDEVYVFKHKDAEIKYD